MTTFMRALGLGVSAAACLTSLCGCTTAGEPPRRTGSATVEVRSGVYSGLEGTTFTMDQDESLRLSTLVVDAIASADCEQSDEDVLPGGLYLTWAPPGTVDAGGAEIREAYVVGGQVVLQDEGCAVPATKALVDALHEVAARELPAEELAILDIEG